jgi:hypothetical protein
MAMHGPLDVGNEQIVETVLLSHFYQQNCEQHKDTR